MEPTTEFRDRQATWRGASDAYVWAVELVATPMLLGLFGFWLDGVFGIRPVLTVVFALAAVISMATTHYYRYKDAIEREQEGRPWTRSPQ